MGDSERTLAPEAYQKHELAKDILVLADTLGLGEFALVGHDWGGVIAQEMALLAPERVKALVVLNIFLLNNRSGSLLAQQKIRNQGARAEWYQVFQQQPVLAEAMIPGNEEVWIRYFVRSPLKNRQLPEDSLQAYIQAYSQPHTPTTAANYYRTMFEDVHRWKTLQNQPFTMPALIIYGQRDPVVIPEYFEGHQNCFTQLRGVVNIEAGHFVQEEQPEAVAMALTQFLEEVL
jgi:pimeloyl-ACP methyl ester carboxylesterase